VAIVAAGGTDVAWEGGAAIIGAGAAVWLLNLFFRIGAQGDRERDAEDEARAFFDRHGHWPDEEPPARPAAARADPHRPSRPDPHPGHPSGPARRRPRRP
jgi:hypothetical protein